MSDAVVGLLAGLGGALIGAGAAIGAQWQANRHDRKQAQQRELSELTARLWECADRLWRSSQGLDHAVIGLENSGHTGNEAVRQHYEERRQDSMRRQHEAEVEGRWVAAQMRLRRLPTLRPRWSLRPTRMTTSGVKSSGPRGRLRGCV